MLERIIYVVEVTASDGSLTDAMTITATVTDANEAPSITSSNSANVAEKYYVSNNGNGKLIYGDGITYSISGGKADQSKFSIDGCLSGALTFALRLIMRIMMLERIIHT